MIDLSLLMDFVSPLISVVALFIAAVATRKRDVNESIEKLNARMKVLETEHAQLAERVRSLPNQNELHAVQLSLAEQSGTLQKLGAMIDAQNQILANVQGAITRTEDFLIENAKK